ncbi:MAG: glycoside hydrolase family 3 N-terminal domain-containing protein [Balneolaceae bacterium]
MTFLYTVFTGLFPALILIFSGCKISETSALTDSREVYAREHQGETGEIPLAEPVQEELVENEDQDKTSEITETVIEVDIDSLLTQLTLKEKIGQLFSIPVTGTFRNEYDQRFLEWKRLITQYQIGGIIFMGGDIYDQAMMTNKLQALSRIPLWISQDMEYGAAMRIRGTTRFTPAMGIAASGKPQNAYLSGKITAREAKALGVHQIYAPVLDVNNNPENPVINVRSFSADPKQVARFGQAFIQGVESEGVIATAKHFPGHGDTSTDSHLSLPVINHHYSRLDSMELHPFRIAIENGIPSIMSAHIAFPNISSNPETPGTLDEDILFRILRDSLNFNGLVVTDGLEMSGITSKYSPGKAVVKALQAGADVMLISPDEMTAIHEVEQAVKRGVLSEERIDRSVRKILKLKEDHDLFESASVNIENLSLQIRTPEHEVISDRIARESVTILKNEQNILPIRDRDFPKILFISVADDESGSTGSSFARELRKYHTDVGFHVLDQRSSSEEKARIVRDARNADLLIIGSFVYVRSHQPIQLEPEQVSFLRRLAKLDSPSVMISFGNPYVLQDLPDTQVHLLAWSANPQQVRNSAPALFAGSEVSGTLPIEIPGMYRMGDGLKFPHTGIRFDQPESVGMKTDSLMIVDEIMQKAIEDSVFPGGVVTVVKDGVITWNKGYGYHDYSKTQRVLETDVFDLASVTKMMSTTTSIMKLVEEEKIRLTDRVAKYIPEFDTNKKRTITVEQLLLHTSGLPAFKIYVDKLKTREEILHAIRNEPLENPPGEKYVYSDLGFILLAEIVKEVTGEEIDEYIRRQFFYPMGMNSAHFNPSRLGRWMSRRIPPTEVDEIYGRGIVQGVVHDERAYFMNGVAGHAGLFASGRDIAIWAQMLLNGGMYAGQQYLDPETIHLFTGHRSPINHRGYGFDRKSEGLSSAGTLTSPFTFGHLGFTGTSVWVDPLSNTAIILLTNRTFPNRNAGQDIRLIRPVISDAVMKSIVK